MIKTSTKIDYYLISECMVDPDTARKGFKILSENYTTNPYGNKILTLQYNVILTEFGRQNWNGRKYGRDIFMNALNNNPLIQADINENGGLASEYAHPDLANTKSITRQMTINPRYACALLHKYWEDGNLLKGTYTTLPGGWGDVLRDRIITGTPALVSSRCVGGVDKNGEVLPGLTIVTWDHVFRQSSQRARMIPGSATPIETPIPSGNSMNECAVQLDLSKDTEGLKDFLLSESVSRDKIHRVCDTLHLDYDTMAISEGCLTISKTEQGVKTKIMMPLNKLVAANLYNLW